MSAKTRAPTDSVDQTLQTSTLPEKLLIECDRSDLGRRLNSLYEQQGFRKTLTSSNIKCCKPNHWTNFVHGSVYYVPQSRDNVQTGLHREHSQLFLDTNHVFDQLYNVLTSENHTKRSMSVKWLVASKRKTKNAAFWNAFPKRIQNAQWVEVKTQKRITSNRTTQNASQKRTFWQNAAAWNPKRMEMSRQTLNPWP